MSPSLVALLVFGAIAIVTTAVWLLVRDLVYGGSVDMGVQALPLRRLPLARDERPASSMIGRFDGWFARLVVESGLEWTPITAMLVLLLGGSLVGGALFVWMETPFPALLGMLLGMGIVVVYMTLMRSRRIRKLQDQLPAAMDMLARGVHAGESLEQALQMVGDKSPAPLAIEFRRAANQMTLGLSVAAVMRSLVYRVQLQDVQIFTSTLTVHRQAGGNLATTLERLASVIRDRLNSRRQQRAATSAGRMSATFLAIMGPLVFTYLFIGQRDYVNQLLESPMGQSLLVIAIFLEIVGMIWIFRMLRTE
ncbi:MAG: type II secretion system F family protein [Planctomycetota bacterium]|nr:type II secretion system F family protein [Planctomycetota bacterium]